MIEYCDTFWGSHGCGLTPGHDGDVHRCGPEGDVCSEMRKVVNSGKAEVRFYYLGVPRRWGDWTPGWRWFSNHVKES